MNCDNATVAFLHVAKWGHVVDSTKGISLLRQWFENMLSQNWKNACKTNDFRFCDNATYYVGERVVATPRAPT